MSFFIQNAIVAKLRIPIPQRMFSMKHIDCRQEWVKMIRNKNILLPLHVDTKDNMADLFTKILPLQDFIRLRDRIMVACDLQ